MVKKVYSYPGYLLSTTQWRRKGVWRYSSTLSWPRHSTEVNGQLHTPVGVPTPRGKGPRYPPDRRLGGPQRQREKCIALLGIESRKRTNCMSSTGICYNKALYFFLLYQGFSTSENVGIRRTLSCEGNEVKHHGSWLKMPGKQVNISLNFNKFADLLFLLNGHLKLYVQPRR
jgi:hypothetical protein